MLVPDSSLALPMADITRAAVHRGQEKVIDPELSCRLNQRT